MNELPDSGPSLIRSLVDTCPNLTRLSLEQCGYDTPFDPVDARLLHDLESLSFRSCYFPLDDNEVVKICEHNPALTMFNFDESPVSTRRAYADGFSLLHRLENLEITSSVAIDDRAFEAVILANSTSLRSVDISDASNLSLASLSSLGFHCSKLEMLNLHMLHEILLPSSSTAAMYEFAQAVAASPGVKETKVRVLIEVDWDESGHFEPADDMPLTGSVVLEIDYFMQRKKVYLLF